MTVLDIGLESAKSVLTPIAEDLLAEGLAALPDRVDLCYVSYDDRLHADQIQEIIDTGNEYESAGFDSWESDNRHSGVESYLAELKHECHWEDWQMDLVREDLTQELWDRDESDPFGDLLRNTGSKWLRYQVGDTLYGDGDSPTEDAIDAIVAALGLDSQDSPELRAEIGAVLAEAGFGAAIYILWRGDLKPVFDAIFYDHGGEPSHTITWTNPYLLLFNRYSGSGHAERITATVTVPFTNENLSLDEGTGSFTDWVCGGWSVNKDDEPILERPVPSSEREGR